MNVLFCDCYCLLRILLFKSQGPPSQPEITGRGPALAPKVCS